MKAPDNIPLVVGLTFRANMPYVLGTYPRRSLTPQKTEPPTFGNRCKDMQSLYNDEYVKLNFNTLFVKEKSQRAVK